MTLRSLAAPLMCAALLLVPTAAHAAPGATIAGDPAAQQASALDGTLVWVTGAPGRSQRLMQRREGATAPVQGAPTARFYRSIDLGRDRRGRLVLTYQRCATPSRCVIRRDDLAGRRSRVGGLGVRGCTVTTAPALWRTRAAYGVACRTGRVADPRRSGLYVKTGPHPPRRMPRPADAARFGVSEVASADLRGTRAAGVLADIYSYAFAIDVDRTRLTSVLAAASEGDSDQHALGLALGRGGALWSLTTAEHAGDPLQTIVDHLDGDCRNAEVLTAVPDVEAYPATDLAVDGRALYLVVPGTGIVAHTFAPTRPCG
jgi:hypothetical protein